MEKKILELRGNLVYFKGYVMLPLKLSAYPSISIRGISFIAKREFHVSIIAIKKYTPILTKKFKLTESEAIKRLISEVNEFVSKTPLVFNSYTSDVRMVKREGKASLIILVKIDNIDKLYNYLRSAFQIDFDDQPTHMTLYTIKINEGIGLNSQEDLDAYSTKLNETETRIVLNSVGLNERGLK